MDDSHFPPLVDNSKPLHLWFEEQEQYRVKVRTFSKVPPEVTIQRISFTKDVERYENAYDRGDHVCGARARGRRELVPVHLRDQESIERSARRAKTNLRLRVTELAPSNFCTFTTREVGPTYLGLDDWLEIWGNFIRYVRAAGSQFEYVAVLERHPSNPDHLHLHCAFRGSWHYNLLRRFWHMAIGRHMGIPIKKMMRGGDAPGGVQDQPVKAARGSFKHVRKIARYISKYITKDAITVFNRKSYFSSKGITVKAAKAYWLESLDYGDAIREACKLVGEWDSVRGMTQKAFFGGERVVWFAIDPEKSPPPPF